MSLLFPVSLISPRLSSCPSFIDKHIQVLLLFLKIFFSFFSSKLSGPPFFHILRAVPPNSLLPSTPKPLAMLLTCSCPIFPHNFIDTAFAKFVNDPICLHLIPYISFQSSSCSNFDLITFSFNISSFLVLPISIYGY